MSDNSEPMPLGSQSAPGPISSYFVNDNSIVKEDRKSSQERWEDNPLYLRSEDALLTAGSFSKKPSMEMKTEGWLKSHAWWWRHLPQSSMDETQQNDQALHDRFGFTPEECHELRVSIDLRFQRASFVYEMLMRMRFPALIPLPWPALTDHLSLMSKFQKLFPLGNKRNPVIIEPGTETTSNAFDERFTDRCDLQFNLDCEDSQLASVFISTFIAEQRLQRGIPNPKSNQGTRNRGMSWKPIELCDIDRWEIRSLDDSERSQLSKCRRNIFTFLS